MNLDLVAGTPLWDWYYSGASFVGFMITVVSGAMVVGLGSWRAGGIFFKTLICGASVAAMPLGLASMGLNMAISDPELVSIVSIVGVGGSVVLGVPYLIARAFMGRNTQSAGQPEEAKNAVPQVAEHGTQVVSTPGNSRDTVNPGAGGADGVAPQTVYRELEFRSGPRSGETMSLRPGSLTLGRSPDNDIVIDDPSVSREHARLSNENGRYYIEDLGSMNGTMMNGKRVKKEFVGTGASVKIGGVEVVVGDRGRRSVGPRDSGVDGPALSPNDTVVRRPVIGAGWLAIARESGPGDIYQLRPGTNVIGRDDGCDLSVDDQYISRKHALVSVSGGKASIADLGSLGGLKVNDRPVTGAPAAPGTEIAVGETRLRLLEIESLGSPGPVDDPSKTLVVQGPTNAVVAMVVSGPDAGKSFRLKEGTNMIGRTEDCRVQLSDETVTRQHAQILYADGRLSVSDLGSRSGTKVGDTVLAGTPLSNGDVVSMGRTRFTLMGAAA